MFSPLAHQFIRKSGCPDAEKSGIKRQGIINLAICDTPCHHYISRRMRLRKHILDLFARPDIPIRHFSLCHGLLHFRLQSLSFPDALHNGKSKGAFHPHPDQVHHNIIPRANRRGDRRLSLLNQSLGVPQPYIRTMSQSGNPYQIRKCLGLCVNQHLHGKFRTELRNSQSAQLTAADLLRHNPKRLRIFEQRHHRSIVQRNLHRINTGKILQHTYHGRIIVSEYIQF